MKQHQIQMKICQFPYFCLSNMEELVKLIEKEARFDRYILLTDPAIPSEFTTILKKNLAAFARIDVPFFPFTDTQKNWKQLEQLLTLLLDLKADRKTCLIAMGGGCVGNLVGMAAGLIFRGIPFLHLPTTLMACADSVLSLKQGVNFQNVKNVLGLYYPPKAVFFCKQWTSTLTDRDIASGWVEFVKNLLTVIPEEIPAFLSFSDNDLRLKTDYLIEKSIQAKTKILAVDFRENQEGLLFEYGHTVGHALEILTQGAFNHGEAIAIGMLVAGEISGKIGGLDSEERQQQYILLEKTGIFSNLAIRFFKDEIEQKLLSSDSLKLLSEILLNDNKRGLVFCQKNEIGMVLLKSFGTLWKKEHSFSYQNVGRNPNAENFAEKNSPNSDSDFQTNSVLTPVPLTLIISSYQTVLRQIFRTYSNKSSTDVF